jgi:MerR family transcriptional regulator, multidrug-efflux activator
MEYTVKQAADLAGVSVRTLHHYDHIGLLRPFAVTEARYRLYNQRDLERLQQILFFRELGFELRKIGEILNSPDFDARRALLAHRELLVEKQNRLGRLIQTIDESISRLEREEPMNDNSMFQGFDSERVEEQIARYRDEAIEKYGKETVERSEEQVRSLSQDQWNAIEPETTDINQRLAELMDTHAADSPEAQEQIERWYDLLNRHFSSYTADAFAGLGELYVADERFTAHYDQVRPGLAVYFRDGMKDFAERRSSS